MLTVKCSDAKSVLLCLLSVSLCADIYLTRASSMSNKVRCAARRW